MQTSMHANTHRHHVEAHRALGPDGAELTVLTAQDVTSYIQAQQNLKQVIACCVVSTTLVVLFDITCVHFLPSTISTRQAC